MSDVIGQNSNPKVINDALQYPEIVVDGKCGFWTVSHQILHQCGTYSHLGRIWILAYQTVICDIFQSLRCAAGFQIVFAGIEPHFDGHQPLSNQIRLAGLFHANGNIGLPHRQVQYPLLQHQLHV